MKPVKSNPSNPQAFSPEQNLAQGLIDELAKTLRNPFRLLGHLINSCRRPTYNSSPQWLREKNKQCDVAKVNSSENTRPQLRQ